MSIAWLCKHHTDLGKEQLYAILQLRTEVFVVEQRHAYQEVDGQDLTGDTLHLMAWHKDKLVAYLRLLDPQSQGGDVVMGRLVTSPQARTLKLEESLLLKGLEAAALLAWGAGLSVGSGAFAGFLCPPWVCGGERGVSGGRHRVYRNAQGLSQPRGSGFAREADTAQAFQIRGSPVLRGSAAGDG